MVGEFVPYGILERVEVEAGGGDDWVESGRYRVPMTFIGGRGDDVLIGGDGADLLSGGPGADILYGFLDADTLLGNDGDDELWPGTGSNIVGGGRGTDQLVRDGGSARGPAFGEADLSAERVTDTDGNPINGDYTPRINLRNAVGNIYLGSANGNRAALVSFYLSDSGFRLDWVVLPSFDRTLRIRVTPTDPPVGAAQAFTNYNGRFDLGPAGGESFDRIEVITPDDGVVLSRNVVRGDDDLRGLTGVGSIAMFPPVTHAVPLEGPGLPAGSVYIGGTVFGDELLITTTGSQILVTGRYIEPIAINQENVIRLSVEVGAGNDSVAVSGDLPVVLRGGDGDDLLIGGDGGGYLVGGEGDDTLGGGDSRDRIEGNAGNDLLSGVDGDDVLNGGAGDDRLFAGTGINELIGGDGFDWFRDGGDDGWDRTVGVEQRRSFPGDRREPRIDWVDTGLFERARTVFGGPAFDLFRNVFTNDGTGFQAQFFLNVPDNYTYDITSRREGEVLFIDLSRPREGRGFNNTATVVFGTENPPAEVVLFDAFAGREIERQTLDPTTVPDEPGPFGTRGLIG
ncbi:MAG: calcium-binding protein [Planctomycetota bacterium]